MKLVPGLPVTFYPGGGHTMTCQGWLVAQDPRDGMWAVKLHPDSKNPGTHRCHSGWKNNPILKLVFLDSPTGWWVNTTDIIGYEESVDEPDIY